AGYLTYKHPYMALHTLARLLTEKVAKPNMYADEPVSQRLPDLLYPHTYYILCQSIFLLTRLQITPDQELYPGPMPHLDDDEMLMALIGDMEAKDAHALSTGSTSGSGSGSSSSAAGLAKRRNTMPIFDDQAVNRVLAAVGMDFVDICRPDAEALDILVAGCLGAHEELIYLRNQVQSSPSYSILYTYVGGSGGPHDGSGPRGGPQGGGGAGGAGGQSVSASTHASMMGVGYGMDLVRQKSALTSCIIGKADWMTGARYDRIFSEQRAKEYYMQGTGKMDRAARETVRSVTAGSGATSPTGGTPSASLSNLTPAISDSGFVTSFFELTSAAFAVPPVNTDAAPVYHHTPMSFNPIVTPALRATAFAAPSLFALAADTMAFAAFQMQSRNAHVSAGGDQHHHHHMGFGSGLDLLRLLRIPSHPAPAKIHRELLSAAAATYCAVLGWCENCLRDALREPDVKVDVVFAGRHGVLGILGDNGVSFDSVAAGNGNGNGPHGGPLVAQGQMGSVASLSDSLKHGQISIVEGSSPNQPRTSGLCYV
ncbi:hypothetical protein HDU76_000171, partial [Blyttiomyces sp. JEL0837]